MHQVRAADVDGELDHGEYGDTDLEGVAPDLVEADDVEVVQAVVLFEEGKEPLDVSSFVSSIAPPSDVGKGNEGFLSPAARVDVDNGGGVEDGVDVSDGAPGEVSGIGSDDVEGEGEATAE